MSRGRGIGRSEYMEKRVPKNAKYQHVKTRLDTGCSLTKYMERLEEIKQNYRYRGDEIFKRLKVTTFAQMILQVAAVSELNDIENDTDSQRAEDSLSVVSEADLECLSNCQSSGDTGDICHSARSTLLSVVSGVGEMNLDRRSPGANGSPRVPGEADRPYPDCPYLLLDVRDRDEYERCHIVSAQNFPVAMLSRSVNPYNKEMLEYKNTAGKIIIVYDEDERLASHAATNMCERGFENLFMLSGGLKIISKKFPEGLTTGALPSPLSSSRPQKEPERNSQAAESRRRFTADELTKIQDQLEEVLVPSCTSSRMSSVSSGSRTSRASRLSSAASQQSSSAAARDGARIGSSRPWK